MFDHSYLVLILDYFKHNLAHLAHVYPTMLNHLLSRSRILLQLDKIMPVSLVVLFAEQITRVEMLTTQYIRQALHNAKLHT